MILRHFLDTCFFDGTDQTEDLVETESETYKSQMYGHNAGEPVSSLYTMYYLLSDVMYH